MGRFQTRPDMIRQIIALTKDTLMCRIENDVVLHAQDHRRPAFRWVSDVRRMIDKANVATGRFFDQQPLSFGTKFAQVIDDDRPIIGGKGEDAEKIRQGRGEDGKNLNG